MALRSDLYGQELVAVKDGGSAEALRREAELLQALDHPGIVRFVALSEDDRGLRLLTRYAGRETLATWRPRRIEELAAVFVDLAEAVRYLHAQGVAHHSIRPAHVVIDAHRRPLLCGFSAARHLEGLDPAAERLADVAAVGTTMLSTLDGAAEQQSRSGRRRDDERLRARLRATAQAAADGRVPSAKALAGQILTHQVDDQHSAGSGVVDRTGEPQSTVRPAQVPQRLLAPPRVQPRQSRRALPGRPGSAGGDPRAALRRAHRGLRRPRRATLVALVVVCGGCVLGAVMVVRLDAGGAVAPAMTGGATLDSLAATAVRQTGAGGARAAGHLGAGSPVPAAVTATTAPLPGQAPGGGAAPAPTPGGDASACRPPAGGFRDITGDGCAEEILIASGSVFVDGSRYPVGEADDQVAVGDWDCDGVATVAVVQSGGRVYVFDGWPESTALAGRLVADLAPPVHLADITRGACNELVVHYAEGTWHLPLPGAAS